MLNNNCYKQFPIDCKKVKVNKYCIIYGTIISEELWKWLTKYLAWRLLKKTVHQYHSSSSASKHYIIIVMLWHVIKHLFNTSQITEFLPKPIPTWNVNGHKCLLVIENFQITNHKGIFENKDYLKSKVYSRVE